MKTEKPEEKIKEPSLPVNIPLSLVRWLVYSLWFSGMLSPWLWQLIGVWGFVSVSLVLGHFASQLNALINKK